MLSSLLTALIVSVSVSARPAPTPQRAVKRSCPEDPQGPAKAAQHAYRQLVREYADTLPGPGGKTHRERRVEEIIGQSLDVRSFSRRTLARAWEKASPEQRAAWTGTLGTMLHRKYRSRLKAPHRHRLITGQVTIKCRDATVVGRLVRSGAPRSRGGNAVALRMSHDVSGWRIYDVAIDGTSLLATWRHRFRRFYRAGGLRSVQAQLAKLARRYPCKTAACRRFAAP